MKYVKAIKLIEHCGFTSTLFLGRAAICAVALGSVKTVLAQTPPVANTQSGLVTGTTVNGVNEFLGIPYAAPPMGALRWTPPTPYGLFPGLSLQATKFGSKCPQQGAKGSEDCLVLNVYAPQNPPAVGALPVMVWIHGGGLTYGSGDPYDPTQLVNQGVIVVTFNYRLGFLGFFAQSAIDAEGHLNGNYGLMDQQYALQWVQANIASFGGDPSQVTIFGQSAGGQSVYAQLASPFAAGLFRGAIAESGSYLNFEKYYSSRFFVTLATAETKGSPGVRSGAAISASVGCTDQTATCLRAVPASKLVAYTPSQLYPFVDGTLLPSTISAAFATGQFNRVPVISGTNQDEHRYTVANEYDLRHTPITTSTQYSTAVANLWGSGMQAKILSLYPYTSYPSGGVALGASGTDGIYSCPGRKAVQSLSNFVTTFAYEFTDENAPPPQSSFAGLLTFPLGAYHTSELQYLFIGNFFGLPMVPLSPDQQQLSAAMISYWTQFAKTGDPNSSSEPVWSPYSATGDNFQSLIPPAPTVESSFSASHQCSTYWDTF